MPLIQLQVLLVITKVLAVMRPQYYQLTSNWLYSSHPLLGLSGDDQPTCNTNMRTSTFSPSYRPTVGLYRFTRCPTKTLNSLLPLSDLFETVDTRVVIDFIKDVLKRCYTVHTLLITNKKALLSQRRPRDAPNIWVPWKVSRVLATAPGYNFSGNL